MQQRKKKFLEGKKLSYCVSLILLQISLLLSLTIEKFISKGKNLRTKKEEEKERERKRERKKDSSKIEKIEKKKLSTNAFFNKDFGLNGCLFFTFVVIFVYQFDKIPDELVLCAMLGLFVTLPVGSLVCRRNTIFFFTPSNSLDYPLNYLVWLEEEGTKKKKHTRRAFPESPFNFRSL